MAVNVYDFSLVQRRPAGCQGCSVDALHLWHDCDNVTTVPLVLVLSQQSLLLGGLDLHNIKKKGQRKKR